MLVPADLTPCWPGSTPRVTLCKGHTPVPPSVCACAGAGRWEQGRMPVRHHRHVYHKLPMFWVLGVLKMQF